MNQKFKKSFAILAAMTSLGTFSATPAFANESFTDESQTNHVTIYRLYNPNTGEHFYTADDVEKDALSMFYGWKYEGIGWYAPSTSKTPVYRLNNPNTGDHHFTPSQTERNHLIKVGWKDENIAWYAVESGAPIEKGHYEKVWIEGKTEKVPIYEDKVVWICNQCGYKDYNDEIIEHMKKHVLNGETEHASYYSSHEKVVVGYNTVQTPGHYEWQWVAD